MLNENPKKKKIYPTKQKFQQSTQSINEKKEKKTKEINN